MRWRQIFRPWFITTILVFTVHQISQKLLQIKLPFLDNYLDPILLMPMLLHALLWERRLLFGFDDQHILPKKYIILVWIIVSILTEFIFPIWNKGFTKDPIDIVLYLIGCLIFLKFFNHPIKITN